MPLQKCIGEKDIGNILAEVHEGLCGSHVKSEALANILPRQRYFWPTMRDEARNMVNRSKKCQEHAHVQRLPSKLITSANYPIPLAVRGIDLIEALPTAPRGLKYYVVPVDYFARWIEAESLATITSENIQKFVWKNIILNSGARES